MVCCFTSLFCDVCMCLPIFVGVDSVFLCVCVFVCVCVCVCVCDCDAWLVSVVPLHMGSFHLRQFPDMLFRQSSWVGVGNCFRCCRASLELIVYDGCRCDVLFKQSCGCQRC